MSKLPEAQWSYTRQWTRPFISSENGFSHDQRQAIIWANIGLLSVEPIWTSLSEILPNVRDF